MSRLLLAVPAFLPIAGGLALLVSNHYGWWDCGDKDKQYRRMEWLVEGVVLLNSLFIAWLICSKSGTGERLVLFRLYGALEIMFRLDGMGSVFSGLVACLWPLAVLYSFEYMRHEERRTTFFSYYLMTYGVTVGVAFAGNLMTLYLFYELLTLVTFPLVLHPMTKEAARASRTYLYYSIGGAAFAFIGLIFVLNYSATGNTEFIPGGILNLAAIGSKRNVLLFVYLLAFFGFGVKAAICPFHGWLPKAAVAPTPVTALLHAVAVVKSGAFAILRLTYFSFGISFLKGSWAHVIVMAAAMVTIILGSTMAVKEIHWKRRLAYSTISNLSYILLGASMMSPLGLVAALSHMVFHGVMKICSFFCAGAVMHQSGKTYVYELDGIGKRMPVTFGCLTVASLSLIGIPLFAGFVSKWNIAAAAFDCGSYLTGVGAAWSWVPYAGAGVLLYSAFMTAVYMLTVLVRAYFPKEGTDEKALEGVRDPGFRMMVPLVIFALLILFLGLYSGPLMDYLTVIGGGVS